MTPEEGQFVLRGCNQSNLAKGAAMHMLQAVLLTNTAGGIRLTCGDSPQGLADAAKLDAAAEVLERHAQAMRDVLPHVDELLADAIDYLATQRRGGLAVVSDFEEDRDAPA